MYEALADFFRRGDLDPEFIGQSYMCCIKSITDTWILQDGMEPTPYVPFCALLCWYVKRHIGHGCVLDEAGPARETANERFL